MFNAPIQLVRWLLIHLDQQAQFHIPPIKRPKNATLYKAHHGVTPEPKQECRN